MRPNTRWWRAAWFVAALELGSACKTMHGSRQAETTIEQAQPVLLDLPAAKPAELDDAHAAIVRVDVLGTPSHPVAVPYVYGYPLYADGRGYEGVRLLRQENWTGYAREENKDQDGVVHVRERFPALGCVFEGVQQDELHYVPLQMQCDVPAPKERGNKRPAVGVLSAGAKADAVPQEPSLQKAFLGEWHATSAELASGTGFGYFDTPFGLLGFGFKKGKLNSVAFVFDPPEARWRKLELWQPPVGYASAK